MTMTYKLTDHRYGDTYDNLTIDALERRLKLLFDVAEIIDTHIIAGFVVDITAGAMIESLCRAVSIDDMQAWAEAEYLLDVSVHRR